MKRPAKLPKGLQGVDRAHPVLGTPPTQHPAGQGPGTQSQFLDRGSVDHRYRYAGETLAVYDVLFFGVHDGLLVFGTGVAFGFTRTTPAAPQPVSAINLAAEVQRTGTQYVTALAAFAAVVDSLSENVRLQGREAAITALLAAAQEWGTLRGTPPGDNELFKTVSNERDRVVTVRF